MNRKTRKFIYGFLMLCVGAWFLDVAIDNLFVADWSGFWRGVYLWYCFIFDIALIIAGAGKMAKTTRKGKQKKNLQAIELLNAASARPPAPVYTVEMMRFFLPFSMDEDEISADFQLSQRQFKAFMNNKHVRRAYESTQVKQSQHHTPKHYLGYIYKGSFTDKNGKSIHIHVSAN